LAISSRLTGEIVVFDVSGEFSRITAEPPTLSELVKSQLGQGKRQVLFNFNATGWVDSFGISEMLASYISIHDLGGTLIFCMIPPKLDLILEVTGLKKILSVYTTEKEALAAFALPPAPGVD
jgi:stage II sporulation protein AA (anti-sigma F factor antagonist)